MPDPVKTYNTAVEATLAEVIGGKWVATNHWIDTCRKRKFMDSEYVHGITGAQASRKREIEADAE
jgi:hypothetical protein